ncbi:2-oxoisovalerate dehydrogenase subunit alpha 2 [Citrus sinensis]|uniref:2-oxoisovalerate dehydrogenase subunit alpha 2 n=1 Tax=Citrus sinensis TaxID=2711 RepID=A0ACB8JKT5_CITSI|nr:2-oxoisovalerate dehydrogenase subunit alpha 2 [Citrus sinensis]
MKSKVGLLSLIKQSSCTCSMNSHYNKTPLTAAPFARAFKSPDSNFRFSPSLFLARRFESIKAGKQLDSFGSSVNNQFLDFPGGRVAFTPNMRFISESSEERIPCYRVLDDDGQPFPDSSFVKVSEGVAIKMYNDMVTLQTMDTIFYEAQRQGRISFYLTTSGEEAINIASAAAIKNDDFVVPQYREPGVLLWRGFSMQEFANQCFGNKADYGKGRQMPIHYGSNKHNYFTVSSTIATQLPHAVGAAYALKMDQKDACAVTYFGDGGTSDGAVVKGRAYGVRSIRVDGNDALAIYSAVHAAREMAIGEGRPILIEALTYRVGHHTTSDDSTKYRPVDEIEWWRTTQDPVTRFRKWIESNGWWNGDIESELRSSVRKQILHALQEAEKAEKPPISDLFTDVYDVSPSNLREQEHSLRETIKKHPQDYPSNVPI